MMKCSNAVAQEECDGQSEVLFVSDSCSLSKKE